MADKPAEMPEHFSIYTVFPTSLFFRRDISDSQKLLYGLLSCMADYKGYAFPKNATLQRFLGGVSEDTVSRRLKALEEAGAIRIEGGKGGHGIRKIFITGVDFSYLRKNAEVEESYLRKSADGIQYKEQKKKNNNKATEAELRDWISKWAISLGYDQEITTALISDFFAFCDSRKAKGKPFLTVRAVSMQAKRLVQYAGGVADPVEAVARMRYMLQSAITHNWEKVYQIDDKADRDFWLWAGQEYGIGQAAPAEGDVEQW